jgi:predicted amidohydrolase
MADEHRHYTAGTKRRIFRIGEWRICPLVCYDLRFPVWSRGADAFDLQLFVANWPAARRTAWRALLPARAVENQCYVAGVNRIGVDGNGVRYVGDSLAVDALGNLLADLGDREDTVSVRLDGAALARYREKFPAWRDADRFQLLD